MTKAMWWVLIHAIYKLPSRVVCLPCNLGIAGSLTLPCGTQVGAA